MSSPLARFLKADDVGQPPPDLTGILDTARALCKRLEGETHRAVRQAVILTLIVNPAQNAVHAKLRRADAVGTTLRAQVLTILRLLPEAVEPFTENFFADEDRHVRHFAANILNELSKIEEGVVGYGENRALLAGSVRGRV